MRAVLAGVAALALALPAPALAHPHHHHRGGARHHRHRAHRAQLLPCTIAARTIDPEPGEVEVISEGERMPLAEARVLAAEQAETDAQAEACDAHLEAEAGPDPPGTETVELELEI